MNAFLRFRRWSRALLTAVGLLLMVVVHGRSDGASGKVDTTGCSWTVESKNGRFTFAGVKPIAIEEQIRWLRQTNPDLDGRQLDAIEKRVRQIHDQYPISGMYEEGDPPKLLWAAHWYTHWEPNGIPGPGGWASYGIPSEDGSRLVVPVPNELDEDLFAEIYGPDRLKIRVRRDSIISDYECLLRKHAGFRDAWPEVYRYEIGSSGTTLLLEFDKEEFAEISLRDGHVLRSTLFPGQFYTPILGLITLLASIAAGVFIRWICRKSIP